MPERLLPAPRLAPFRLLGGVLLDLLEVLPEPFRVLSEPSERSELPPLWLPVALLLLDLPWFRLPMKRQPFTPPFRVLQDPVFDKLLAPGAWLHPS